MKTKKNDQSASITGPLLERVIELDQAHFAMNFPAPTIGETPLEPASLNQDSGGGYNPNSTFPQE